MVLSGPPVGDKDTPAAKKIMDHVKKFLGMDTDVEASDDGKKTHLRVSAAGRLFSVPLMATGVALKTAALGINVMAGLLSLADTLLDAAGRAVGATSDTIGRAASSILDGLETIGGGR
jgi:hypothetical protein